VHFEDFVERIDIFLDGRLHFVLRVLVQGIELLVGRGFDFPVVLRIHHFILVDRFVIIVGNFLNINHEKYTNIKNNQFRTQSEEIRETSLGQIPGID
jgi:hypothetical protein